MLYVHNLMVGSLSILMYWRRFNDFLLLQAVLALFAANQTSGIVVNIGFHVTTVAPGKQFGKALLICEPLGSFLNHLYFIPILEVLISRLPFACHVGHVKCETSFQQQTVQH